MEGAEGRPREATSGVEGVSPRSLAQKVWREMEQDGLSTILLAITLLIGARTIGEPIFVVYIPILGVFGPVGIAAIRSRLTYPRIGYAALPPDSPLDTAKGMATVTLSAVLVLVVGFALFDVLTDAEVWKRWIPAFIGMVMLGCSLFLQEKSGQARYLLGGVLVLIGGIAFSIVGVAPGYANGTAFVSCLSLAILPIGLGQLVRFLYTHPRREELEESNHD